MHIRSPCVSCASCGQEQRASPERRDEETQLFEERDEEGVECAFARNGESAVRFGRSENIQRDLIAREHFGTR